MLARDPLEARLTMAFDGRWKYVHCLGFAPMLFDLKNDPQEFEDLGSVKAHAGVRERMKDLLLDWSAGLRNRTAIDDAQQAELTGKSIYRGVLIGFWSENDVPAEMRPPALGVSATN